MAGKSRCEFVPDAPTIGESVPGYEANSWCGLGVPRGTPAEIVARLSAETRKARGGGDHADLLHTGEQHLDHYGIEYGIMNPLQPSGQGDMNNEARLRGAALDRSDR